MSSSTGIAEGKNFQPDRTCRKSSTPIFFVPSNLPNDYLEVREGTENTSFGRRGEISCKRASDVGDTQTGKIRVSGVLDVLGTNAKTSENFQLQLGATSAH